MKKFLVLVQKEVKELLTPQVILPLVISAVMFYVLGNVIGKEVEKTSAATKIAVTDFDNSATSGAIVQSLKHGNFVVSDYKNRSIDTLKSEMAAEKVTIALEIPAGLEANIQAGKQAQVQTYTVMQNFSFLGSKDSVMTTAAIEAINNALSNQLIMARIPAVDPSILKNPIVTRPSVIIGDKMAEADPTAIMGFVSQQTFFIPIILFIVIMFAGQMIATSMATEKENKTLETLLSVPVSRRAIVGSKMVGASVIALMISLVYMVGFRSYMNGMTGGALGKAADAASKAAMAQLGLVFNTTDYVLLGLSLFAAILVALAMALILGAFTEDVKSVQGTITPLMVLIMIPYFLVLFLDFNALSRPMQYLVYAIPFSHPFLAGPDLFLGHTSAVIYGIIYQFIVFLVLLWVAARIFSTDLVMTLKLNFGKKR